MEFSKLAGPPRPSPCFGKLLRMTCCFDLWHLKIRGVTFNYSLFRSGEGEGGVKYGHSEHIYKQFSRVKATSLAVS